MYSFWAILVIIAGVLYLKVLRAYNDSIIGFHKFLTTYRQTPRSRFIRKYQPSLEPLYEENSIFEKSAFSS